jgi:hypothetical protein
LQNQTVSGAGAGVAGSNRRQRAANLLAPASIICDVAPLRIPELLTAYQPRDRSLFFGPIATPMVRPLICRPIKVIVSQVPSLAGHDGPAAPRTDDHASRHAPSPNSLSLRWGFPVTTRLPPSLETRLGRPRTSGDGPVWNSVYADRRDRLEAGDDLSRSRKWPRSGCPKSGLQT